MRIKKISALVMFLLLAGSLAAENTISPQTEIKQKNPELINALIVANETPASERLAIGFLGGAFSGGAFGALSGLAFINTAGSTPLSPLYLMGGAFALAGAFTGTLLAYLEIRNNTPAFQNSLRMFTFSWSGALLGGLAGTLAGFIPYSSSQKIDSLLHFSGYGTMAGLALGIALYFILPPPAENLTYSFDQGYRDQQWEYRLKISYDF